MSVVETIGVVSPIVMFVFAVANAIKGEWLGLKTLILSGLGFLMLWLCDDPILRLFGAAVWLTFFHYAGLIILLGPVMGSLVFWLDRPARRIL